MSGRPILAPRDAAVLAKRGLLKGPAPGSPDGMRRLHRQWTYPGSRHEEEAGGFVAIPDTLVSRETLLYVGYVPSEADALWDRWCNLFLPIVHFEIDVDEDGGLEDLTYVFEDLIAVGGRATNTYSEDDAEWTASLTAYGMAPGVQAAILDPLFRDIRLTHSAFFWAKETMAMRYAGLRDIQKASYERETALAAREAAGPGPSSSGQGGTGSQQAEATPPGISVPATWGSAQAMAARHAPESVVLYKGLGKACIRDLWDDDGNVVRLQELVGRTPNDFHAHQSAYSFTPDDQVAEDYAAYAKRRSRCESAAVVAIAVPSAAIKALEGGPEIQRLFWPSPEWKELVWRSRRKQRLQSAHSHLRKYRQAMLTIGSMARRPNAAYMKLASWEAITDEYVLRVGGPGGPMAVQLVFSGDDCDEWLMDHGARTLKAYPLTSQELKTWTARKTNPIANVDI